MLRVPRFRIVAAAFVATLALAGALASAGNGAEPSSHGCRAFDSQADAQAYFLAQGGSPDQAVGKLDPDRDGVACEGLGKPFAGYATIGYNRAKGFLYGTATMPARAEEGYACLEGNGHAQNGIRQVEVLRGQPGSGKPLRGDRKSPAQAERRSGRLVWKLNRPTLPRGSYYVSFQGSYWPFPYGSSECPAFSSRATELPALRR